MRTKKQKAPEKIDRQKTHGNWKQQAEASRAIRSTIALHNARIREGYQAEAIEMIAVKLSRILTGDSTYIDHWADIAGYCERVIEVIKEGK